MRLRTYEFLMLAAIGCIAVFFFIFTSDLPNFVRHGWIAEESVVTRGSCGRNVTTKAIVGVRGARAYLVSAYFDDRVTPAVLRIISIVDRSGWPQLFCHFCNGSHLIVTVASVSVHSEHFGFPYGTADIKCGVSSEAKSASLVSVVVGASPDPAAPFLRIRPVKRVESSAYPRQFSVCISTLFGNYSNVLQFVQAVEMYRILGARKVFIYKSDCSPQVQRVLDYYSSEGLMDVIDWNVQEHFKVSHSWTPSINPGDLHYYGQITALNDCVYRNMPESVYVFLNDIDEVVVPMWHRDWAEMVQYLSLHHLGVETFLFENSVFRHNVFGDADMFDLWDHKLGVNILRHVHREPFRWGAFNARKLMVNPRAVEWASVHRIIHQRGSKLLVPSSLARLHHCRSRDDLGVREEDLVRDTTLWKYNASLIKNVNDVLRQVMEATAKM